MIDHTKKTLYHSALVSAGTVRATVDTDVMKTKFAGKSDYVGLTIAGHSHSLNLENFACAAAFHGFKGRTVDITATGSRESAALAIQPVDGAPGQQTPPAAPAQRQEPAGAQPAPAQHQPTDVQSVKAEIGRMANLYGLCLDAAMWVKAAFKERHVVDMTQEQFQGATSSFFIKSTYMDLNRHLPAGKMG